MYDSREVTRRWSLYVRDMIELTAREGTVLYTWNGQ